MLCLMVMGDPSNDGHGRTETIRIDHNLVSNGTLANAFRAGEKILGIKYESKVAADYEENWIPEDELEVLIEHKILERRTTDLKGNPMGAPHWALVNQKAPIKADWAYEYDGHVHINEELYAAIWLEIARLGEPTLEYTVPKRAYDDKLDIGGYGLFQ